MKISFIDVPEIKRDEISKTVENFIKKHQLNLDLTVSVSFVSSDKIRLINNKYRKIDQSTDVLSFPIWNNSAEIPSCGEINLGEIIICPEKINSQNSLIFLVNHSLKHLIGIHHKL